jgi:hypothetical protein
MKISLIIIYFLIASLTLKNDDGDNCFDFCEEEHRYAKRFKYCDNFLRSVELPYSGCYMKCKI